MRKLARQITFLLIYSSDMGQTDYQDVLQHYLEQENLEDFLIAANILDGFPELDEETLMSALTTDDKLYISETVAGTMNHLMFVDKLIDEQAQNWSTLRMLSADKNILRLGTYELCFAPEKTDAAVIINEAVNLARIYGEEESYKFVNAILDAIYKNRVTKDDLYEQC